MDLDRVFGFYSKYGYVDSAVVQTSARLGLFAALGSAGTGGLSVAELAETLSASPRGVQVLAELLAASGLLLRDADGRLSLAQPFAACLCDPALLATLHQASAWWGPVGQLSAAVRSGGPVTWEGAGWDVLGWYRQLGLAMPEGTDAAEQLYDRAARHYLRTQALICAAELGLLERLEQEARPVEQLAQECGAAPRGLAVLLDALVQLGLVAASPAGFALHPAVSSLLTPRTLPAYCLGLTITQMFWQALGRLDEAVLSDRRTMDLQDSTQSEAFYLALARYNMRVFPSYFQLVRGVPLTLAQVLPLAERAVLDLGTGSGIWAAVFLQADPSCRLTLLDHQAVLAQARRTMVRLHPDAHISYRPADLRSAHFDPASFDVIILGQICHTQPADSLPGLLERLARALRPGGWLILADTILNERRDAPLDYLYFGVREFIATQGSILSLPEYVDLLRAVGLPFWRCYHLSGLDVILAGREPADLPETIVSPTRGRPAERPDGADQLGATLS